MAPPDDTPATVPGSVDELYTLPLQSFTAARNALAGALRKAGRTEEADEVKTLGRPSVSAWAVNQLYWQDRSQFDALLDAGEQFRRAQQAQLAGEDADLVRALDERRDAVAALTRSAARVLHAGGYSPTTETMRRITSTLDAIATHGRSPSAPPHGRLMADVPPPGFEALAALVPRVGGATSPGQGSHRVLAFGERTAGAGGRPPRDARSRERDAAARRASAASAVKAAARELAAARQASAKARAIMKAAAGKATAMERAATLAAARAEKVSAEAETARRAARKAAADAEAAVQALQDAELALERAQDRIRLFDGGSAAD